MSLWREEKHILKNLFCGLKNLFCGFLAQFQGKGAHIWMHICAPRMRFKQKWERGSWSDVTFFQVLYSMPLCIRTRRRSSGEISLNCSVSSLSKEQPWIQVPLSILSPSSYGFSKCYSYHPHCVTDVKVRDWIGYLFPKCLAWSFVFSKYLLRTC